MKICFLVDGHSPIAQNWIRYIIAAGHDVSVISTYPCNPESFRGATVHQAPIAFSRFASIKTIKAGDGQAHRDKGKGYSPKGLLARLLQSPLQGIVRHTRLWLTPFEMQTQVRRSQTLIADIKPDLVHAMRIPFEGIFAAKVVPHNIPLLVSVWGNDFTLFAKQNWLISRLTRNTLKRADALHTDCQRDMNLAQNFWGFDFSKPAIVLPGSGGVQAELFHPGPADMMLKRRFHIPDDAPVVVNPRGFRGYVCNESFFRAIPQVLKTEPQTVFLMSAMQDNPEALRWSKELGIEENVRLLPLLPRHEMAALFRTAAVTVSPSLHDGTPNTLLEGMACGCFPIAGDIESVREWITDGENGLLCDPQSSTQLANAILHVLKDKDLNLKARHINQRLILERADYHQSMRAAEAFYAQLVRRLSAHTQVSEANL